MTEPETIEKEEPVTWARRLRIFMLAALALAFVTGVIKVFQGEEPELWWLYLIIIAVLGVLAWVESTWAVFGFVFYIAIYKFIPILAEDSQPLRKVVLILGVLLACGAKVLYDRRKARRLEHHDAG